MHPCLEAVYACMHFDKNKNIFVGQVDPRKYFNTKIHHTKFCYEKITVNENYFTVFVRNIEVVTFASQLSFLLI